MTIVKINQSYELGSLRLRIYQAGKPYHSTTFAYSLEDGNAKVFHESHMFNNYHKLKSCASISTGTTIDR